MEAVRQVNLGSCSFYCLEAMPSCVDFGPDPESRNFPFWRDDRQELGGSIVLEGIDFGSHRVQEGGVNFLVLGERSLLICVVWCICFLQFVCGHGSKAKFGQQKEVIGWVFFRVDRYCCGFRAPGNVVETRFESDCHLVNVGDGVACGGNSHAFWYFVLEYFHFIFCVLAYQD